MQPYHTLKGSRSLLPSLIKVFGNPDTALSHFEGIKVTFTKSFKVCGNSDANLLHLEGVEVTFV